MSNIPVSLEDVSFSYHKEHQVLAHVNLEIGKGEAVGIIGANGAGKSTLLKLMVGLYPDFQGSIRIDGIFVEKKELPRIREKIGYVFQDSDSQLFMATVHDDVAFGPGNYGFSGKEVEERVDKALQAVKIPHLKNRAAYSLSGGEKKLASIATILSMTPDIILMDEPSIALDPCNRRNLIHILNGLKQIKIIASHDLDLILDTCTRTILINEGRIIKDGRTEELLKDKELLQKNGLELPLRYYYG